MQSGPTHVLVVRGLDENADKEMLRYEFSKHAPIKVRMLKHIYLLNLHSREVKSRHNLCSVKHVHKRILMGIILQDLRLVRDKFTHVSRGFAFVHFHSVCPTFSMLNNSVGSASIFCIFVHTVSNFCQPQGTCICSSVLLDSNMRRNKDFLENFYKDLVA